MQEDIIISDNFKRNEALSTFISRLPQSFIDCDSMMYNGRNTIKIMLIPDEDGSNIPVVIKHFKHLTIFRKILYFFRTSKARRAYTNAQELIRRGFDTPTPVAMVEHKHNGFLSDSYYMYVKQELPTIAQEFACENWNKTLAVSFAKYVADMHKAGIIHRDLSIGNVLFKEEEAEGKSQFHFSLIDINRMVFLNEGCQVSLREGLDNLTRLTGYLDLYELIAEHYISARGESTKHGLPIAKEIKKRHDKRWEQRKSLSQRLKNRK